MGVWHTYSTRQTLSELETDKSRGLSGAEAERRLARWGPNRLEEGRRQGLLLRFLGQMKDPMILVLLAAAALSLWASGGEDWLDAAIILVIVVVNACISISQEDSAEKALEALRKMSAPLAKVVRDGALQRLETDRLVPGDIIHLEAGDLVPADARILEAASLQADESAMTGESVPVSKGLLSALPEDTPLAERHNMVLASTVITRGRAVCVVTGTGMDTEVGRIAGLLLGEGEGQTPLQKKMAEISKTLSFVCLCVCAVMFGVGLLQGRPMLDMFLTAVSLAVAAIPEGLPAIVTIVLALGVARMARRRAIVKRLMHGHKVGTLPEDGALYKVRFALRLAVVMTISTTVSLLWEFEHTYWFPLHAFLLLQPSYEESAHRMITRPVGTAIGCLVVHLVYPWLPGLTGVFAFALAMISLMYCCTPGSWVHPIFSTSFALALATLTVKEGQAIQLRLFYLLLAVALVLVVNRFLVPTRKATQFRHNLRTLCRLQASYWELVQRSLHAPGRPERSGEILACFHLVYHEAARYAAALPAGEAERYRTVLLTLWNLFAHVEQVECLVLTGELGEEEYPVLSRLAGEIQELLDPPRPALAELGLEGLPASGALCRAMERYRHNARLLLEAWEKQPVSC